MKIFKALMCLGMAVPLVQAQDTNEIEQLKRQMQLMKENFEAIQNGQRQQIDALSKKIEELLEQQRLASELATNLPPAAPAVTTQTSEVQKPGWSPTDPIRIGKGSAYADLGMVGTFAVGGSTAGDIEGGTQLGGHDPNQNGFTVQGVELNLTGAVDPYFRGNMNVLFSLDSAGESFLELEEAWLETISLPGSLTLRAGQYLTDFGRINLQHPHAWAFVDSPLVSARLLGPDGLRNPGAQLSWLMPTPFYSQLSVGIQNSQGATAASFRSTGHAHGDEEEEELPFGYRHADNNRGVSGLVDMLIAPRWATSFDLTDSQTLVLGASGAFGPNNSGESGDTYTQIYGVDVYWKWKSPRAHGGFPFVSWQTEAMLRRYDLGTFDWQEVADEGGTPIIDESTGSPAIMTAETVTDYGVYSQLLYGFKKGWVAGMRGDFVSSDPGAYEQRTLTLDGEALGRDPMRAQRFRLSPNLTWYPSEFSKIRLQYNYDNRLGIGQDHSVWLQFEFLLGAHAVHTF